MTLQARLEALATAIRDKLNAMTPRLQPQGGTAGQALVKNTADDYDAGWVNLTKESVGLTNVDNTSDANKPVSGATQTALNAKANLAGATFTGFTVVQVGGTPLRLNDLNSGTSKIRLQNNSVDVGYIGANSTGVTLQTSTGTVVLQSATTGVSITGALSTTGTLTASGRNILSELDDKVSSSEVDIIPSNYIAMASSESFTADYTGDVTTLTIPVSTAGRASSAVAKSGDFLVELEVTSEPYDFFFWLSSTVATTNTPTGTFAGIEAFDTYFYDKSGSGAFKPFDRTLKFYYHRVGTTIDIYEGPTFQNALYRHSIPCPAGALFVNYSAPGYASYGASAKIKIHDIAIPAVFNILTLAPHRSIGAALEKKAGLTYPTLATGLQIAHATNGVNENLGMNQFGGSPFRLFVNSRDRGKWVIGDLSVNEPTRVLIAAGTLGSGTFSGFEFDKNPYVGVNVMYHAGNLPAAIDTLRPRSMSIFCSGKPANNERIGGAVAQAAFTIAQANCRAMALVAATASTVLTIKKASAASSPQTVGTVTFAAGATLGTTSITTGSIAADDFVWVEAPATADATLADISLLLRG